MKRIVSFSLLVIIVLPLLAIGCSEEPHPFVKQVDGIRKRIKNAPGRTGILAEEKLYSCFDEELIIRDFFQDKRSGFFVDVGCAWPIESNNTYYLEKHLGWKGIGIDALNDFAPAWKKKRPNSKFFNYLVTENSGGSGSFYKSESLGVSSVDKIKAEGSFFQATLKTEKILVPKISLNDLLDREGVKKIDLLSLDIEGHELMALKGLDLERFSPELIVTETFGNKNEVIKHLKSHGYQQIQRYIPFDEVNLYFCRTQEPVTASDK